MIVVYNTLTRKKEKFVPLNGKKVRMFVCGPTVYDHSHIGHGKTFVAFDVIARYLRYRGYDLFYLQNITDIDDKMIKRANEEGTSVKELAEKYSKSYFEDMETLNVTSVDKYAYATDYIKEIIEQINGLMEKGYAYETSDGVYYDISKKEDYGKLSKQKLSELKKSRIEPNPEKRNPGDFSLWKKKKPGEPYWNSPWGKGRPGWHIEDTAITIKHFGPQYDIHGGAIDLIFPHHEAEIAQAEAYTGKKPFVKYWLHAGFLNIEGEKMSKSLGNFLTIKDAVKKYGAENVRFFLSINQYIQPINFNERGIFDARAMLERIRETTDNLQFLGEKKEEKGDISGKYRKKFIEIMDNNFDTTRGIAVVMECVREINRMMKDRKIDGEKTINNIISLFKEWEGIFGVDFVKKKEKIPEEIKKMAEEREEARRKKEWERADSIREELRKKGWRVVDTEKGPKLEKIDNPTG